MTDFETRMLDFAYRHPWLYSAAVVTFALVLVGLMVLGLLLS